MIGSHMSYFGGMHFHWINNSLIMYYHNWQSLVSNASFSWSHKYSMQECKLVPIFVNIMLSPNQCHKTQEEKEDIKYIPLHIWVWL